jgi:hypothetical protein
MNLPTTAPSVLPSGLSADTACEHSRRVRARLVKEGLHSGTTWRISPTPFLLGPEDLSAIQALGPHLLRFIQSLNGLYDESVRGLTPSWVAEYLDQGKPGDLLTFARMKRFRDDLPGIIRPDLILTEQGLMITEIDAVPGGIGITGCLGQAYSELGWRVIGNANGMAAGFEGMIRRLAGKGTTTLAIVVSDEAKEYRPEMIWLASRLSEAGVRAKMVEPQDIIYTEEGLRLSDGSAISVLYRFFELFDLKNIPMAEPMLSAVNTGRVAMTAPAKPWLEEKLAFALLHHPALESFWARELGLDTFSVLQALMPRTWILDPRPVPPHAVIPGLMPGGVALSDYRSLARLGQKQRRFVIKPSGFSELAWGSRGVSVGHDLSQPDWARTLEKSLASFPTVPHILQEFRKGRRVEARYHDGATNELMEMPGRVRLSPYYFASGDTVVLGGILATICPLDKKLIHGMTDAIMAPCALQTNDQG